MEVAVVRKKGRGHQTAAANSSQNNKWRVRQESQENVAAKMLHLC